MTIDIDDKLYNTVVQWCEINNIEVIKYIEKALREKIATEKYGDLNAKITINSNKEKTDIDDNQKSEKDNMVSDNEQSSIISKREENQTDSQIQNVENLAEMQNVEENLSYENVDITNEISTSKKKRTLKSK